MKPEGNPRHLRQGQNEIHRASEVAHLYLLQLSQKSFVAWEASNVRAGSFEGGVGQSRFTA